MKPFLIKDLTQDCSVHRTVGLGEEIPASVMHCSGFVKRESKGHGKDTAVAPQGDAL
jgi:hypothetical protein